MTRALLALGLALLATPALAIECVPLAPYMEARLATGWKSRSMGVADVGGTQLLILWHAGLGRWEIISLPASFMACLEISGTNKVPAPAMPVYFPPAQPLPMVDG